MKSSQPIATFKALSALLCYPEEELISAIPQIRQALHQDGLLTHPHLQSLGALLDDLQNSDIYDLQERYILLFDRTKSLSLHIFEHVHGESRDRGQAMIDLKSLYAKGGMTMAEGELPDFLPLFLEYCATQPLTAARDLLGQPAHVIAALAERLRKRGAPYEAIFRALASLGTAEPRKEDMAAILAEPETDPNDMAALDAAWEEEAVTFGPGANTVGGQGGCGVEGLATRLRHAQRAVPTDSNPLRTGGAA
jgi:nitrate reductase delta subunit